MPVKRIIKFVIFLIVVAAAFKFLMYPDNNVGYSPKQFIAFDHSVHSGKSEIACEYCHSGVEKTKVAGIPSVDVCMNCHISVLPTSPLIKKITKAYKNGTPLVWVRVHDMADFVHFNHKRHTAAGINCITCHGEIYKQSQVRKTERLNMGTCVACHKNPHTRIKAFNKYDKVPVDGKKLSKIRAAINCSTCHY